ncbi:PREDICTED: RNA-binding protein 1 [Nelumbo nucifera]|uniref:RRM domain-containing protein n=2 Tax=Nelumbo nucifera TaxID=4432 RepID=A0A822Y7Q9_NELNU|nr:PREDICTED: RNA-binding protein 1 [Nelumbo nucifera]DAD27611.1 TPA_asm: hypothetical protein HUJ06_029079 [Nelumbo nucifera]
MATASLVAASLAPSSLSSSQKNIGKQRETTSAFLRHGCSSFSLSSLCFPSHSLSATRLRHQNGIRIVGCLPSSPENTTTVSTKLYVSGLSFRTTEESLRNAFKNFGQLIEVNLVMDRRANRPRGFAFLRYATEEESKKAIEGMHGKFLDGRVIFVEVAKPRSELRQIQRKSQKYIEDLGLL